MSYSSHPKKGKGEERGGVEKKDARRRQEKGKRWLVKRKRREVKEYWEWTKEKSRTWEETGRRRREEKGENVGREEEEDYETKKRNEEMKTGRVQSDNSHCAVTLLP